MVNRYLAEESIRPRLVRETVPAEVIPNGKVIKIKEFPVQHKVKVFRVVLSTHRTDYIVTNEIAQDNAEVVQEVNGLRWKVEQFHREIKQVSG